MSELSGGERKKNKKKHEITFVILVRDPFGKVNLWRKMQARLELQVGENGHHVLPRC